MKLLVTGGAGFIGSHLAENLLKEGNKVVIIDNFNDYYNPQFKERNIAGIKNDENLTLYRGDIKDVNLLNSVFQTHKFDKIIHLAASAGVRNSIQDPQKYVETNLKGTTNLLEKARKNDIKDFIFASSSSVYGNQSQVPFKETDACLKPISPYAATKRAAELLCHTYHYLYKLNITALRFFTVYGPRGRPDMAAYKFTDKMSNNQPIPFYGDGASQRDYTYIADIIEGVKAAINIPYRYEIINLGNNKPEYLRTFIKTIEEAVEKKAIIEQKSMPLGDVEITYADITKAKELLNWKPTTPLQEGIKKLVEWYNKINFSIHDGQN